MTRTRAYELPNKKKNPELYKGAGMFNAAKFGIDIGIYARNNMSPEEAKSIEHFLVKQGKDRLKPKQIKNRLSDPHIITHIREVEFILALQGGKIEKKDIFKPAPFITPACDAANNKNKDIFLQLGEVMCDSGNPITKQDILETRLFFKGKSGKSIDKGRIIAIAAIKGNLDQVKAVVEMNGEKLGKEDLMLPISKEEAGRYNSSYANKSIAVAALENNSFDTVEQILTEEGASLCVKDVLSDFKAMEGEEVLTSYPGVYLPSVSETDSKCLEKLLISPVFKDTSENITEMWKELPDEFKTSKENQKAYQTALGKAKYVDAKNAAKALNKAGIAAIKSKVSER